MNNTFQTLSFVLLLGGTALFFWSGCSGSQSEALKTTEGRLAFMESVNKDNKHKCTFKGENTTKTKAVYTCTSRTLAQITTNLNATCEGYNALGFQELTLKAKDGQQLCTIANNCQCAPVPK